MKISLYSFVMSDCPLLRYLTEIDEPPYKFAERATIARATIYALINGSYGDVKWKTLALIEHHTGRRVSVQELSDWLFEREVNRDRDDQPQ